MIDIKGYEGLYKIHKKKIFSERSRRMLKTYKKGYLYLIDKNKKKNKHYVKDLIADNIIQDNVIEENIIEEIIEEPIEELDNNIEDNVEEIIEDIVDEIVYNGHGKIKHEIWDSMSQAEKKINQSKRP